MHLLSWSDLRFHQSFSSKAASESAADELNFDVVTSQFRVVELQNQFGQVIRTSLLAVADVKREIVRWPCHTIELQLTSTLFHGGISNHSTTTDDSSDSTSGRIISKDTQQSINKETIIAAAAKDSYVTTCRHCQQNLTPTRHLPPSMTQSLASFSSPNLKNRFILLLHFLAQVLTVDIIGVWTRQNNKQEL